MPTSRLATLLTLALPVALARATQAVDGFADAYMIAPLGKTALTATTTGSLNFFGLFIFAMGMCTIIQSYSSQFTGQGDIAAARRYGSYGLLFAAAIALLGLAAMPFIAPVVSALPYDVAVKDEMARYIEIRSISLGGGIAIEALGNWYGGTGNTKLAMRAGLLSMVINIAANWLLIGGNWGCPALGVEGAAWSSVIANWLAASYMIWHFVRDGRRQVGARVGTTAASRGGWRREFFIMLWVGLPAGLNWFFEFSAWLVFVNGAVSGLGDLAVGALNVVMQINSVSFMPAFGLATAGAILAGQAIGAKKHDEVPGIVWLTFRVTAVWMLLMATLYALLPALILGVFSSAWPAADRDAFVAMAIPMLMLSAAWQLFDAAGLTLAETLRAAGDTFWPTTLRIAIAWLVFLPCAWLAVEVWRLGVVGLMAAIILYIALIAGAMWLRFRSGRWRAIELTASP
ncbi:MAG: MATE family efflux transporter [Myxococcales bacterium]|nr:MATE family efflux transporter [Myxococcales bacterium]